MALLLQLRRERFAIRFAADIAGDGAVRRGEMRRQFVHPSGGNRELRAPASQGRAHANPSPEEAPVTRIRLPEKLLMRPAPAFGDAFGSQLRRRGHYSRGPTQADAEDDHQHFHSRRHFAGAHGLREHIGMRTSAGVSYLIDIEEGLLLRNGQLFRQVIEHIAVRLMEQEKLDIVHREIELREQPLTVAGTTVMAKWKIAAPFM